MDKDLYLSLSLSSFGEGSSGASKDSALKKSSGMQWSFSNKAASSTSPQYLSFKIGQERKARTFVSQFPALCEYFPVSAVAAGAESLPNAPSVLSQVRNPYATYSQHHLNRPGNAGVFTGTSQLSLAAATSAGRSGSHLQSPFVSAGLNHSGPVLCPEPIRAIPSPALKKVDDSVPKFGLTRVTPQSLVAAGVGLDSLHPPPNVGANTADPRNASRHAEPAQMTIFYKGAVHVYPEMTPDKAQTIMLLAGSGISATLNEFSPPPQAPAPIPRSSGFDEEKTALNPSAAALSTLCLATPAASQANGSEDNSHVVILKNAVAPTKHPETFEAGSSSAPAFGNPPIEYNLPQARKASLTRFIERRKGRVVSSAPYFIGRKSPDRSTAASTSSGSCPPRLISHNSNNAASKSSKLSLIPDFSCPPPVTNSTSNVASASTNLSLNSAAPCPLPTAYSSSTIASASTGLTLNSAVSSLSSPTTNN